MKTYTPALLFFLPFELLLVGCSPAQLYPDPELPDSLTSHLYFSAEYHGVNKGTSFSSIEIDQKPLGFFDAGARILPGKHSVGFQYEYRWSWCDDVYDDTFCLPENSWGACRLEVETKAGKTYRVELRGSIRGASAVIVDTETYQPVATQFCGAS